MRLRFEMLLAVGVVAGCAGVAMGQGVTVDKNVTIVCAADEPGAMRLTAKDLADDLEHVLGVRPKIVATKEEAGAVGILIAENARLPEAMRPAKVGAAESFSILSPKVAGQSKLIVLTGPDMRGTMYAVYQFSEQYLGVDPMEFWTDKMPPAKASVEIPVVSENFPAPVFKYRGFFLNDEDLLTGWAPGDKDKAGISLAVWDKIFETILRLKGNMVVPGSWIFPDDPQVGAAGKRGLILNQHHATPLGVNVARWPKDATYNYTTHPEILEKAWKNAVATYAPGQEILWTVGLRGLSDVTYAAMDPSVQNNDKALGALIGKAIADQMSIVRAAHPDAKFITDLWSEGAKLVQQGYLKLPSDATPIWADNGYGFLQDKGLVTSGQGAYYHVAMMNSRSNQLTEMVPVERIIGELSRYEKAGATQFLLLNTSDIRPVVMTAKAVMDIAWKGSLPGGKDGDAYYRQFAASEFGEKAAPAVTEIYKEYFAAPVHFGPEPLEYGDMLYHQESVLMMYSTMLDSPLYFTPGQAPKWDPPRIQGIPGHQPGRQWALANAGREMKLTAEAGARWDAVWTKALAAEALVEPAGRDFYHAQVMAMIAINRQSNRILYLISQAIQFASKGQNTEAKASLAQTMAAFDEIQKAETAAEYGKWKNWYRGDWLTNIGSTRRTVEMYSKYLDDPLGQVPLPIYPRDWEAYYHIMHYEGDRTVDVH